MTPSGVIGNPAGIPWNKTSQGFADLKHFKQTTSFGVNPAIIMGRVTHESIGRLLPGRMNIIIGSSKQCGFQTPEDALWYCTHSRVDRVYVIGGSRIYEWFAERNLYDSIIVSEVPEMYVHEPVSIGPAFSRLTCRGVNSDATAYESVTGGFKQNIYTISRDYDADYVQLIQQLVIQAPAENRTAVPTRSLYNQFLRFDISGNRLPATRLRKQSLRMIFEELMWFIRGRTDLASLHERGVTIWDANVQNPLIPDPRCAQHRVVGPIYGHQWRNFGAKYDHASASRCEQPAVPGFDQLRYVVAELRRNPTSRRIMLSSWCPPDIHDAVLPPCHVSYMFNVSGGKLYCQITQRSSDVVLALNWNILSGAMLTHILARVSGLEAAEVAIVIGNAHIYENHIPAAQRMLNSYSNPTPGGFADPVRMFIPSVCIEDLTWGTSDNQLRPTDVIVTGYDAPGFRVEMVV